MTPGEAQQRYYQVVAELHGADLALDPSDAMGGQPLEVQMHHVDVVRRRAELVDEAERCRRVWQGGDAVSG